MTENPSTNFLHDHWHQFKENQAKLDDYVEMLRRLIDGPPSESDIDALLPLHSTLPDYLRIHWSLMRPAVLAAQELVPDFDEAKERAKDKPIFVFNFPRAEVLTNRLQMEDKFVEFILEENPDGSIECQIYDDGLRITNVNTESELRVTFTLPAGFSVQANVARFPDGQSYIQKQALSFIREIDGGTEELWQIGRKFKLAKAIIELAKIGEKINRIN